LKVHSWVPVFWAAVACNVTAAALALIWLKPRVTRLIQEQATTLEPEHLTKAHR
jgi:hypothetical protein